MTRSSVFRKSAQRAVHAAVLLLAVTLSNNAAAEVVEPLTNAAFERDAPDRPTREKPLWINRDDCLQDDVLHFAIKVTSPSDNNFEVWVGDKDCKDKTMRTGANAECWQVWGKSAPTNNFTVDIRVQDVIAMRTTSDGEAHGTIANCNDSWQSKLVFYFMYVDDTGDVSGTGTTWNNTGVDIEGPLAPSNVTAGPGDNTLVAKWDSSDSLGLTSYNLYCVEAGTGPAPTSTQDGANDGGSAAPLGDAGRVDSVFSDSGLVDSGSLAQAAATADSGATQPAATSAGDAGQADCWGAGLTEGQLPSEDLEICGSETSRTATVGYGRTGVTNGTRYALAVAAVDELGNPGALSNVACTVPEPVRNFYESYNAAGGGGGGGICAVAAIGHTPGRAAGTVLPFGVALVLGWSLHLRRRSARRPSVRRRARSGRKVNS